MDERRKFVMTIIIKHRLSISITGSMTAENGAIGQGLGQGDEGGWSLPSPAVGRRAGVVHYILTYSKYVCWYSVDSRAPGYDRLGRAVVRCGAMHSTAQRRKKTSRLQALVGDRLLVGLVNPAQGVDMTRGRCLKLGTDSRKEGPLTLTSPFAVPWYGTAKMDQV